MDALCKTMRDAWRIAALTNDIYTREDAEFLTRSGALAPDRILGVETGGCPHTAIRKDASINPQVTNRDARRMRGERPFIFTNLKTADSVAAVAAFIVEKGGPGAAG